MQTAENAKSAEIDMLSDLCGLCGFFFTPSVYCWRDPLTYCATCAPVANHTPGFDFM